MLERERSGNRLVWAIFMALGLLAPEIHSQDTLVVNLSISRQDFHIGTHDGYDVIVPLRDRMDRIRIPGHPQLPTWSPAFIIPWWKDIAYCEILALDSVQIPGTYNVYPAQVEVPIGDSADWTPPDPAIYNSDSLYPGKLQNLPGSGAFDGARIATLNLYPIQYRPKSGKLFLYTNATLRLVFKDSEPPINAKQRYAHVQEIYDHLLADLVENDFDIGAWYRRPAITDPNEGKYTSPPSYIIITTEAQAQNASLQDYKNWMYQRGYPTLIVTVQQALQGQTGVDDAERLRNYIIQQYNNGVSFFLFLGYEDNIPWRYLCAGDNPPPGGENIIPSDLYFSSLNGNWNGDGDEFFGEPMHDDGSFDFTPEVFVGRVLAKTMLGQGGEPIDEIANWVYKVINYEKNPGNANGITHVFSSCGQGQFGDYAEQAYPHYPQPPFTFSMLEGQTAAQNLYYMNTHLMGWVNIYAHGEPAHWAPYDTENYLFFGPRYLPFGPTDVNLYQLTNQNAYPIVYSISCRNAAFDDMVGPYPTDTTVCEGWVEAYPNRGAIAFLGNTRNGFLGANSSLHYAFLDILFAAGSDYLLGTAEAWSRASLFGGTNYTRYIHNLFGSPLTEVWTNVPVLTTTTALPTSIQRLVPTIITVTVKYDNGFSGLPFQVPGLPFMVVAFIKSAPRALTERRPSTMWLPRKPAS